MERLTASIEANLSVNNLTVRERRDFFEDPTLS
jgi:hypothetical protein